MTLALVLPALASAEGNISVTSSPVGAEIYLDDSTTGLYAPGVIESVTAGTHTVKLILSGYESSSNTAYVTDNQTSAVDATLTNLTCEVYFSSYPAGATVYVDGTKRGYTNDSFTLGYGSRAIVYALDDYENWSGTLLVDSTSESVTAELESTVVNGSIYFTSSPSNAEVYLFEEYYGTTPLTVEDLAEGSYDIIIYKSGYENWTDVVYVTAGEEYDEDANLDATGTAATTVATTATTVRTATPVQTIATVAASKTYDLAAATVTSTKTVPTPWPTDTAAAASPLDPLLIIGAVGLGLAAIKRH
jgi:hypothetical protein